MVYRWLCWLPLVTLLAVEAYVAQFDGQGALAAAPLGWLLVRRFAM